MEKMAEGLLIRDEMISEFVRVAARLRSFDWDLVAQDTTSFCQEQHGIHASELINPDICRKIFSSDYRVRLNRDVHVTTGWDDFIAQQNDLERRNEKKRMVIFDRVFHALTEDSAVRPSSERGAEYYRVKDTYESNKEYRRLLEYERARKLSENEERKKLQIERFQLQHSKANYVADEYTSTASCSDDANFDGNYTFETFFGNNVEELDKLLDEIEKDSLDYNFENPELFEVLSFLDKQPQVAHAVEGKENFEYLLEETKIPEASIFPPAHAAESQHLREDVAKLLTLTADKQTATLQHDPRASYSKDAQVHRLRAFAGSSGSDDENDEDSYETDRIAWRNARSEIKAMKKKELLYVASLSGIKLKSEQTSICNRSGQQNLEPEESSAGGAMIPLSVASEELFADEPAEPEPYFLSSPVESSSLLSGSIMAAVETRDARHRILRHFRKGSDAP